MNNPIKCLAYEIEVKPGEKLTLPPDLIDSVGAGRWLITVAPAGHGEAPIRDHGAFLNGYAKEDEGLYDACSGR